MYSISMENFRGFHNLGFLEIRPITLLVGENSAGKSSFLAALKYTLDLLSRNRRQEASFNKDPFQLGTFQQISHYRGGKAGRAKSFSISLKANMNIRRSRQESSATIEAILCISFVNADSQAVISSITVSTCEGMIRARVENEKMLLEYANDQNKVYTVSDASAYPRVSRAEFARYWPLLIRDLRFRRRGAGEGNNGINVPEDIAERVYKLSRHTEQLLGAWHGDVEATSAIRTKPLRTYTPGAELRDGEGSHVPFEIAKLYRSKSKEKWKNLKSDIERFGASSEMFTDMGIKSFGGTASDPFQLQFSSYGPKTNLIDLGYGTSQVLPILHLISTSEPGTTFLVQQPEVHLHPKAQAALGDYFVHSYLHSNKLFILETHSDFIVDRIRSDIAIGKLKPDDVSIIFFERRRLENTATQIVLAESGDPVDPPETYREFFLGEQLRILGLR